MFNPKNVSYILNGKEINLRDMSQQDIATFTPADKENLLAGLYSYYEKLVKEDDQNSLYWCYRIDLVDLLLEIAGDEYYDRDDLRALAKTTDYQLIDLLDQAIDYIMNEAEDYLRI